MIQGMTVTTTTSQEAEATHLTAESGQVRWTVPLHWCKTSTQAYKAHNPARFSVLTNRYLLLPGNRWNRSWGLVPSSVPPPPSLVASYPLGWPLQLWFFVFSVKWRLEQKPSSQYQSGALPSSRCPTGLQPTCREAATPKWCLSWERRHVRCQPAR